MNPSHTIIIGSRGSKLALVQSEWARDCLRHAWPDLHFEVKKITTRGDKITDVPLSQVGGKGIFTREIDLAQVSGEIDLAVHSMKDVPTELHGGLVIAAIPKRERPNDSLISRDGRNLGEMPEDAVIGTSSLRRRAQLLAHSPAFRIVDLRGNVDTRLRKLDEGQADAIILAAAGMARLGIERANFPLPFETMLPAPGQGALAITAREGEKETWDLLAPLHDPATARCVEMERNLLARLGGGCQIPFGTAAIEVDGGFELEAALLSLDGTRSVRARSQGTDPEELCDNIFTHLEAGGLQDILKDLE